MIRVICFLIKNACAYATDLFIDTDSCDKIDCCRLRSLFLCSDEKNAVSKLYELFHPIDFTLVRLIKLRI